MPCLRLPPCPPALSKFPPPPRLAPPACSSKDRIALSKAANAHFKAWLFHHTPFAPPPLFDQQAATQLTRPGPDAPSSTCAATPAPAHPSAPAPAPGGSLPTPAAAPAAATVQHAPALGRALTKAGTAPAQALRAPGPSDLPFPLPRVAPQHTFTARLARWARAQLLGGSVPSAAEPWQPAAPPAALRAPLEQRVLERVVPTWAREAAAATQASSPALAQAGVDKQARVLADAVALMAIPAGAAAALCSTGVVPQAEAPVAVGAAAAAPLASAAGDAELLV